MAAVSSGVKPGLSDCERHFRSRKSLSLGGRQTRAGQRDGGTDPTASGGGGVPTLATWPKLPSPVGVGFYRGSPRAPTGPRRSRVPRAGSWRCRPEACGGEQGGLGVPAGGAQKTGSAEKHRPLTSRAEFAAGSSQHLLSTVCGLLAVSGCPAAHRPPDRSSGRLPLPGSSRCLRAHNPQADPSPDRTPFFEKPPLHLQSEGRAGTSRSAPPPSESVWGRARRAVPGASLCSCPSRLPSNWGPGRAGAACTPTRWGLETDAQARRPCTPVLSAASGWRCRNAQEAAAGRLPGWTLGLCSPCRNPGGLGGVRAGRAGPPAVSPGRGWSSGNPAPLLYVFSPFPMLQARCHLSNLSSP